MQRNDALEHVYHKYSAYYGPGESILSEMIKKAIEIGEHSCSVFEEYASLSEPSYNADDLERLFDKGVKDAPSIKRLVKYHVPECRHILKIRTALTRDCDTPIISVQYIIVW